MARSIRPKAVDNLKLFKKSIDSTEGISCDIYRTDGRYFTSKPVRISAASQWHLHLRDWVKFGWERLNNYLITVHFYRGGDLLAVTRLHDEINDLESAMICS